MYIRAYLISIIRLIPRFTISRWLQVDFRSAKVKSQSTGKKANRRATTGRQSSLLSLIIGPYQSSKCTAKGIAQKKLSRKSVRKQNKLADLIV